MKKIFSIILSVFALFAAFSFLAGVKISGKVTNEKGEPVIGATVVVKGSGTSTKTDAKGEFILNASQAKLVLIITAAGYQAAEVQVKDESYLTVKLKALRVFSKTLQKNEAVRDMIAEEKATYTVGAASRSNARGDFASVAPGVAYGMAPADESWRRNNNFNREGYDNITENRFLKVTDNPLSTFSIDVDAASYSNVRRYINSGSLPPAGAVRIEEMINYFKYDYPQPKANAPFSVNTEIAVCPWNEEHRIVSIGLQGRKIAVDKLPPSNLTFLIDVSGSMNQWNKLPLVKSSLKLLVDQLRENDKVSIVVYAGNAGLVLPPASGSDKMTIKNAIDNLEAGGSTAGGEGIKLAYKTATENLIRNGNNRVILCTDGDFNVGASSDDALERLIEEERNSGVFLTVLGYGMGNYQDAKMQKLADKGNGNHAYIDNLNEAKKVLVNEFGGTLFTIAKDVKLQVEFNPAKVQGYRLIGYENRMLAKEDFNNDKKDAGELGSGHTVTALYEIIPAGVKSSLLDNVDNLKYQKSTSNQVTTAFAGELMNIKLRYKEPDGDVSKLIEQPVNDSRKPINNASDNLKFATAVAQFGMLLRDSKFKGTGGFEVVEQLAKSSIGKDVEGYRKEFIEMVDRAKKLNKNKDVAVEDED